MKGKEEGLLDNNIKKKKKRKMLARLPEQRDFCLTGGAETDAVHAILARYLQRRLQGSQLSTPPPPAVLFSSHNQARVRQGQRTTGNALPRNVSEKERRGGMEDYEDYEDDLEGFEDSERSRTRFDLFAGKSLSLARATYFHIVSRFYLFSIHAFSYFGTSLRDGRKERNIGEIFSQDFVANNFFIDCKEYIAEIES